MIDFLIRKGKDFLSYPKSLSPEQSDFNPLQTVVGEACLFMPDQTRYQRVDAHDRTIFIIGDIVGSPSVDEIIDKDPESIFKGFPGLYYLLILTLREVDVYSSLFGILPVYYAKAGEEILVSSRAGYIKACLNDRVSLNKQWILERILFNHSLDGETPWREIRQLPAHHALKIRNNKESWEKYLAIEDCFADRPKPWRKSLGPMSELFSERCRHYFTCDVNRISFTGGFDGRTLLACALGQKVPVHAYSFGASSNPDITIPKRISAKLGIPYSPIHLDQPDYMHAWLPMGKEMMDRCDGNTSLLHVHYLYSAMKLQGRECLVTGMFGSELLRALHVSGQVTARPLVDFFMHDEPEEWQRLIMDSPRLQFLNVDYSREELAVVWEKLLAVKKEQRGLGLSRNQGFYKFIFDETFRKVFGNFILPQLQYAPVRAPYLDFVFIKELLQTGLAGVNNDFFTHNPVKRAKGQMLYARIIQQNHAPLLRELNDKGYRPRALLSPVGKFSISWGWAKKRLKRRFLPEDYDNLAILSAMHRHMILFKGLKIPEYFDSERIHRLLESTAWRDNILQRDNLVRCLSLAWFLNDFKIRKSAQ